MPLSRRSTLKKIALGVSGLQLLPVIGSHAKSISQKHVPEITAGPFEGTRASLRSYQIPQWFRDAKFGIWAHWGPQSAVEYGDWYARNMYIQGHKQNEYHVKNYGHPSKVGFKDLIPQWKAEKFDADYLMSLYKKAGAKYFMTMGVHHDNFDMWNSQHNRWNAVNMGPKKDIVGLFKKAAQKQGLRFGVSDHLWVTHKWYSTSKGADLTGPLAGVPYDGADPKNFDYYGTCDEVLDKKVDWNENGIPEAWKKHWFDRMKDLVEKYEPDLLYSDGHLPFEEHGLNLLAHLYNTSAAKYNGVTQAVYTSKRPEDSAANTGVCVFDVERGVVESIWPEAWQTDTCVGEWHYNKERIGRYKTVKTVIDLLVDIVSRNGNLMLNFPLPGSGMLDSDELAILDGITTWMNLNSEGIYASRPWKIFGEGPQSVVTKNPNQVNSAQQSNERNRKQFTHEDIRFTTKGGTLYAFMMGWPDDGKKAVIKALGTSSEQRIGSIENIELLGHGKVAFTRGADALTIDLPANKPADHATTFKISGKDLM